jgi:hypothetical protein
MQVSLYKSKSIKIQCNNFFEKISPISLLNGNSNNIVYTTANAYVTAATTKPAAYRDGLSIERLVSGVP